MSQVEHLKKLREELDLTYEEMKQILSRNKISRRMIGNLPDEEYKKYKELDLKSMQLISEFINILSTKC